MTQITVKPHVGVTETGFERVARAIKASVPPTHHADIMDALEKLQCDAKINLWLSVLTLTLLILHLYDGAPTYANVEKVARQVAATLNLGDKDLEDAVQYCVRNVTLAEAPSTGEQEGAAQASTRAPTSESGKSGRKKG